jgi:PTH2 family peptidyl-tRNA hydrolase
MSEVKQVIVWRKDLNVRKGKLASQAAHASLNGFLNLMRKIKFEESGTNHFILMTEYSEESLLNKWLDGSYTKIVLGCENENELLDLYNLAQEKDLPTTLVTDNGLTEFNGVKTNTCISIGPFVSSVIDSITGHLKPL